MSIQHFAAAPGQIISFLLSSCLKSLAESATLLIGSGEELRCAPPISGEEGRGRKGEGGRERGGGGRRRGREAEGEGGFIIRFTFLHRCLEFQISVL